ncbi:hypothetical protein PAXRUDRAFT_821231 [Paxillus rubicundulus Ve08.2h10]|uniref:Uncharacterized protein n=1 Tax=Paxillus rubicundulus Ve08.2h10 TaxID=930991 RepID=A0A0D0EDC7_9AGAM|nr:hypothetical protein PAXRUDRAFT_821231 [Paxillus rubicundulus Ve08.2h10]
MMRIPKNRVAVSGMPVWLRAALPHLPKKEDEGGDIGEIWAVRSFWDPGTSHEFDLISGAVWAHLTCHLRAVLVEVNFRNI